MREPRLLTVLAIPVVQPGLARNYTAHPIGYLLPVTGVLALAATLVLRRQQRDAGAFVTLSLFILAMLGSTAWGCYPHILIATSDPMNSLTIFNATAGAYGLKVGLVWFVIAFSLTLVYTIAVYRAFWGKVRLDLESSPAE